MFHIWRLLRGFARIVRYRGAFLLFLALLDLLFGYSLWVTRDVFDALHEHLPGGAIPWTAGWCVSGLACLICAFLMRDRVAFTLAVLMMTAWGALSLKWFLAGVAPKGWISVVIWWSFAATIAVVSAWPDPPLLLSPPQEELDLKEVDGEP